MGSDTAGTGGLFFNETRAERIQWLTLWGRSESESSTAISYVRTGINIDDDVSCYDARVRFGLVLNNESTIYTLNDAAGFGASAYDSVTCENSESAWQVAAGFAAGPRLYQTAGTLWVR